MCGYSALPRRSRNAVAWRHPPMDAVETQLRELRLTRATGAGVKETSYYLALAILLNAVGKTLKPRVHCPINVRNRTPASPTAVSSPPTSFKQLAPRRWIRDRRRPAAPLRSKAPTKIETTSSRPSRSSATGTAPSNSSSRTYATSRWSAPTTLATAPSSNATPSPRTKPRSGWTNQAPWLRPTPNYRAVVAETHSRPRNRPAAAPSRPLLAQSPMPATGATGATDAIGG